MNWFDVMNILDHWTHDIGTEDQIAPSYDAILAMTHFYDMIKTAALNQGCEPEDPSCLRWKTGEWIEIEAPGCKGKWSMRFSSDGNISSVTKWLDKKNQNELD